MITLITKDIENEIIKEIKKFLKGEIDNVEIDTIPPDKVTNLLSKCGVTDDFDDMDTNGWQWDYWIKFNHNNEKYVISGCGYYGKVVICKYDEQ